MGYDHNALPEHVKDKMSNADHLAIYGEERRDAVEEQQKSIKKKRAKDERLEKELHGKFAGFLWRHELPFIHCNPTKASTIEPGTPDFCITYQDTSLYVEFKVGYNKLSPVQETRIAYLRKAGDTVLVSYSYEEA
ncbi:MAG: hypothetical protein JO347_02090, partial [Candidatus Eremiobacteraeota bacterium]|nr:hypothetical protein [Candidatus Eremiobacteraeota bacterium]